MPAIDIGLGFGAALQNVEERLVEYVAAAYHRATDRPLTAFALARHIEHLVGLKGLSINPGVLLGWVQTFEERTGRMILEKIADTRPQQYRFVYDKNLAYPGENTRRTKG